MDNMSIYNKVRHVPDEAKKAITAGRLKGFTDINPMWRIKALTEAFGPAGVGWWYDITDKQIVYDEITGQKAAFVDVLLYYVDPATGHESHGIPGTGGSSFVAKESSGPRLSDECFKMALTDAISVAAKAIGVGADVYYEKDRSKYTAPAEEKPKKAAKEEKEKKPDPVEEAPVICPQCGEEILPTMLKGKVRTPDEILKACGGVCIACWQENKARKEGA